MYIILMLHDVDWVILQHDIGDEQWDDLMQVSHCFVYLITHKTVFLTIINMLFLISLLW